MGEPSALSRGKRCKAELLFLCTAEIVAGAAEVVGVAASEGVELENRPAGADNDDTATMTTPGQTLKHIRETVGPNSVFEGAVDADAAAVAGAVSYLSQFTANPRGTGALMTATEYTQQSALCKSWHDKVTASGLPRGFNTSTSGSQSMRCTRANDGDSSGELELALDDHAVPFSPGPTSWPFWAVPTSSDALPKNREPTRLIVKELLALAAIAAAAPATSSPATVSSVETSKVKLQALGSPPPHARAGKCLVCSSVTTIAGCCCWWRLVVLEATSWACMAFEIASCALEAAAAGLEATRVTALATRRKPAAAACESGPGGGRSGGEDSSTKSSLGVLAASSEGGIFFPFLA